MTNVLFSDLNGVLPDRAKPHATPWIGDDKGLVRILYVPEGMSVEEARKIVGDASPDKYAALILPDATLQRIAYGSRVEQFE